MRLFIPLFLRHGWRPVWINDLQRAGLESGVFIGSPGRLLVEQPWARLPEEAG